jgi:23S rRNA (pseudouridine1915-N3)-methyltransferase
VPRLIVAAIAARLPGWAREAREQYRGRMPRGFEVEHLDLKTGIAKRVHSRLPGNALLVALDERGREYTTREFAERLAAWRAAGVPVAFVIGGPDGLDPALRDAAQHLLRLSALTLPHALAQVVLYEQLYRAASLLGGHPYHRQ